MPTPESQIDPSAPTSADLTLPGTLPGLLRRTAPVVLADPGDDRSDYKGETGIVSKAGPHSAFVRMDRGPSHDTDWTLTALALDLTDPAGMDIAARWLAERVGLTVGATAPQWRAHVACGSHYGSRMAYLRCDREEFWFVDRNGANLSAIGQRGATVPGINDLTDPRAALRLACLHAAIH